MSDAKLTIAIGGKLDASLTSAVNSAEGMLDRLNGGSGKSGISKVFSGIGQTIATTGKAALATWASGIAGVTALSKAGINTYMDYEAAFSDVAATAGIAQGTEQWEQLDTAIQHVGETTNKTAMEAASAAKYMFLAGWDQSEVEGGLDTMVKLSSALNADMGLVSDLITDSMSAAHIGVEDMQHYADLIAQADSAANYTGVEMMEALLGAAGTARDAGVGITDLATAAGILADNGTKGAQGGTALTAMLTNMFTATEKGGLTAMRNLGVDAYNAAGQVRPLFDILTDLSGALDSVSEEQRNQSMYRIFGKNWKTQGTYLLDSVRAAEDGTTAYQELNSTLTNAYMGVDQFGNSLSVMNDRYDVMTNNLKGDKDLLDSATDSFLMSVGKSMNAELRELTQETTKLMQDFTKAFKDEGWTGLAEEIGNNLQGISDALGEKGPAVIEGASSFVENLTKEIGGEGADVGGAAAKIITSIGTSFAKYTDDFVIAGGKLIQGLMDGMIAEDTAGQWATGLGNMVTNIGTWFSKNGAQLGETAGVLVTQLAQGLADHSGDIISGGIAIVGGIAKGILTGLPVLASNLPNILKSIVGGIKDSIPEFLSVGAELGEALMEGLGQIATEWEIEGLRGAGDDMQYLADNAEAMNAAMTELWANTDTSDMTSATQTMVENLISGKTSVEEFSATLESMRGYGLPEDVRNMDAALSAYTELAGTAREQLEATQQEAQAAAEAAAIATEATAESSAQTIEQLSESVMSQFESAQTEAEAAGSAMQEALTIDTSEMSADALSTIIESIDTGNIDQITAQFETAMTALSTSANTASTSVQTSLSDMGTNSLTSVTTSLTGMITTMSADFVTMIELASITATSILSSFSSIDLGSVASDMMAGLVAGIEAGGALAIAAAQSIASQIASTMASALKISSPSKVTEEIGNFTGQGLAVGMEGAESDIYSAAADMADAAQQGTASNVLRNFAGGGSAATAPQMGAAQAGGGQIVFSPQITITGNASEADVRSALSWSIEQFRQMYRQMQSEDKRMSFA